MSKTNSGVFSNAHHQFHKSCVAFIISFCNRFFFLFGRPLLSSWWCRRIIRTSLAISWSRRSTWTNTWHVGWWSTLTPFLLQTVRASYCRSTLQLKKKIKVIFCLFFVITTFWNIAYAEELYSTAFSSKVANSRKLHIFFISSSDGAHPVSSMMIRVPSLARSYSSPKMCSCFREALFQNEAKLTQFLLYLLANRIQTICHFIRKKGCWKC